MFVTLERKKKGEKLALVNCGKLHAAVSYLHRFHGVSSNGRYFRTGYGKPTLVYGVKLQGKRVKPRKGETIDSTLANGWTLPPF